MSARQVARHVPLEPSTRELLARYADAHGLSARALHRCCKVARTLADLQEQDAVDEEHLLLALTLQQARWER